MAPVLALLTLLGADPFDRRCVATDEAGNVQAEAESDDALECREPHQVAALRAVQQKTGARPGQRSANSAAVSTRLQ